MIENNGLENGAVPASISLARKEGRFCLILEGEWNIHQAQGKQIDHILSEMENDGQIRAVEFDTSKLRSWDSSLLLLVYRVEEWSKKRHVEVLRDALPAGVNDLIALSEEVPERKTGRKDVRKPTLLAQLGFFALQGIQGGETALNFGGQVVLSLGRMLRGKATFDWRLFWLTMEESSARALPIVGLISFLTGLILAFVGAIQLRQFGAGIYVANLVAVAMAREMGAIMTGVIMAGRTGAAFAAQIGSMKVSEEIDALETLAISPIDFLVSPRMLALCLMMPLLVLYSDAIGIFGGMVVGISVVKVSWIQYWNQTVGSMAMPDILTGLIKGAVFGCIVAVTGCQRGINSENNAAAVGNAATSAVVLAITWIVATDAIADVIQNMARL